MNLIRLSKSSVGIEEKQAVCRVLDDGYLGMGSEVQQFEQELKEYLSTDLEVICVNSGTAALHIALDCLNIGAGDEVLVPSITYVATYQAITATGATPISCEVMEDTVFLDLEDAKKRITSKTRAVIPVHYASDSQSMDKVYEFAKVHKIRVIEDAAHSFGSRRNDRFIGSEGDILCFSFDGIKNITCGEGGAVLTSDKKLALRIKDARLLGVHKDTEQRYSGGRSWNLSVDNQGFRYHMSNIMAAIGREQLKKIAYFSKRRQEITSFYVENLKSIRGLTLLNLDYKNIVPHIFPVRILNNRRDYIITNMRESGVECGIHYMPNHLLSYFKSRYQLKKAELIGNEIMTLPLHPNLIHSEIEKVVNLLTMCLSKCNEDN